MRTISWATHTAYLDDMTGIGMLVMPNPDTDVSLGGMHTLHTSGQDEAIRDLIRAGWEPLANTWGGLFYDERRTASGNSVVSLFAHKRIISQPTIEEDQAAVDALAIACELITEKVGS